MESHLDEVSLGSDKSFMKQCEPNERIIMATKLFKINEKNKKQDRVLAITTKFIYNLSKKSKSVHRKMEINRIRGITLSKTSCEFVIYVPDEYDYRYLAAEKEKRDLIVDVLNRFFFAITGGRAIPQFFVEEASLEKYTALKTDKKKGVDKMPNERTQVVKNVTSGSQKRKCTLYSKNKGLGVSNEDFMGIKELGKGDFGTVMVVQKVNSDELYALKAIKRTTKEIDEDSKEIQMIIEYMEHPFLVRLEYCFYDEEKFYYVTSILKGGDLFQHLQKDRRFTEARTRFYIASIVFALSYFHNKNMIYKDLKPENVLMGQDGYICLTDFGLARMPPDKMDSNIFYGTPEYFAPEVITGESYTKQVDWWSLGVLMYEMLTGIPPFYHTNQKLMFQLIVESEVKFPSQVLISEDAKDLIIRLLVKDPNKRIGAINGAEDIFKHPWLDTMKIGDLFTKQLEAPFRPKIYADLNLNTFDEASSKESFSSFMSQLGTSSHKTSII